MASEENAGVKYVVSIAGELLYYDDAHRRLPAPPREGADEAHKLQLKLVPPETRPAASPEWDAVLGSYSAEQRGEAQISVALP